jgi:hypothetical protein
MARVVGNLLKLIAQLGGLFGGCTRLADREFQSPCETLSRTFEVLCRQQDRAQMVLLDERLDVRRDGGSVEAHHKQLALCDAPLARPTASVLTCAP